MSKLLIAQLVLLAASIFQPVYAACPPDDCKVSAIFPSIEELTNIARQKALGKLAATSSSLSSNIIDRARSSIEDPAILINFDSNKDAIHSQLDSHIKEMWNMYLGSSFDALLPTGLNAIGPRSPELFASGSLAVMDFNFGTTLSFDTPAVSEVRNWSSLLVGGDISSVGRDLLGHTHVNITGSVTTPAASFSGTISLDPVSRFPLAVERYRGSFDAVYNFSLPSSHASGSVTWSAYGTADSSGSIEEWGTTITACTLFSPEACVTTNVPEPNSFALVCSGLIFVLYGTRRRNQFNLSKKALL